MKFRSQTARFIALLLPFALGGCLSGDGIGSVRIYQSDSPAKMGAAIFAKEVGFQDTAITFYVRDPKVGAKAINLGFAGDQGWQGNPPKAANWSKDGSIIAVRSADEKAWSLYYDFKNSEATACDIYPMDKRAKCIGNLLQSRGGVGSKVMEDWAKFDEVSRLATRDDDLN